MWNCRTSSSRGLSPSSDWLLALNKELDPGEAEAIVLARQLRADLLLMDEALGRRVAMQEHLPVIGLVGVLLLAKEQGLLDSLGMIFAELEAKAGFFLSQHLKQRVLQEAGESGPPDLDPMR